MIYRFILGLVAFSLSLNACASYWFDGEEFVFLEKRAEPFANIALTLESPVSYNKILRDYEKRVKEQNLLEWEKEFKNKYTKKEVEAFLYKKEKLSRIENKEIKEYIEFLSKQEKFVKRRYYYYWDKKENNNKAVDKIINEALIKIENIESKYLKLRYFFLGLRLAHYENRNALKIYNKYKHLISTQKTIVNDWIEALYAGILVKSGKEVEGVYEFSKLYDENKINWYLSFYNFKYIDTQKEWEKLQTFAKNEDEKMKFIALRALNKNANALEELKNIGSVNINSKYFDLILYRALLKSQSFFDKGSKGFSKDIYKDWSEYLEFVKRDDEYLVNLALAYFSFYQGEIKKSKYYLSKIKDNKKYEYEVNNLDYIIYLEELKEIDLEVENEIYEKLEYLKGCNCSSNSVESYTFLKLIDKYKDNEMDFKSYLASQYNYFDESTLNLERYRKLIEFLENADSNFDIYLAKHIEKYVSKNTLNRVELAVLINNNLFEKALELENNSLNQQLEFDIFASFIRGNNREGQKYNYTLKSALSKLLDLEENIKKDPKDIKSLYEYANAFYNLSYFGNSSFLTTVYRSNYSFSSKKLEEKRLALSIKYYKEVLKYSKDKEFKAKVTYMLAKAELASFDLKNSKKEKYSRNKDTYSFDRLYSFYNDKSYKKYIKQGYGEYFDNLKNDYSNTKYYKELIKECANLRLYEKESN